MLCNYLFAHNFQRITVSACSGHECKWQNDEGHECKWHLHSGHECKWQNDEARTMLIFAYDKRTIEALLF